MALRKALAALTAVALVGLAALVAAPEGGAAPRPNEGLQWVNAVGGRLTDPDAPLVTGDYLSVGIGIDTLRGQATRPEGYVARVRTTVYWDDDSSGLALTNRCLYRHGQPSEFGLDAPILVPEGATTVRVVFALDKWDRRLGWYEVDTMDSGTVNVPGSRPWAEFSEYAAPITVFTVFDSDA